MTVLTRQGWDGGSRPGEARLGEAVMVRSGKDGRGEACCRLARRGSQGGVTFGGARPGKAGSVPARQGSHGGYKFAVGVGASSLIAIGAGGCGLRLPHHYFLSLVNDGNETSNRNFRV